MIDQNLEKDISHVLRAKTKKMGWITGQVITAVARIGVEHQAAVLPVHPAGLIEALLISIFLTPEADLEGDDHLGVVHLHDVPQVQLPYHFHLLTSLTRLLVFLGNGEN